MKKKALNQFLAAALVCGSLFAVGNISASAKDGIKFGMKMENGNIYFYDQKTGAKEVNKWELCNIQEHDGIKELNGWYHSDANGMMQKNVIIKDDKGNDCVLGADGKLTNRKDPEFNESKETGSKVEEPQAEVYSWKQVEGNWYFVNSKGEKKTGWVLDETTFKWYYCNKDGVMQKDTTIIDGEQKFVLDSHGVWIN